MRLLKLNADEEQHVSAELGVSGIPALLLFRGGKLIARTAGAMDAEPHRRLDAAAARRGVRSSRNRNANLDNGVRK